MKHSKYIKAFFILNNHVKVNDKTKMVDNRFQKYKAHNNSINEICNLDLFLEKYINIQIFEYQK